jgi:hypothetical protein
MFTAAMNDPEIHTGDPAGAGGNAECVPKFPSSPPKPAPTLGSLHDSGLKRQWI